MINDYQELQDRTDENEKRTPPVEYGYDKKVSPYVGCVDCFQVSERMLSACQVKES